MSGRPILSSAPMVRALLDGRKTQTRRVMPDRPLISTFEGRPVVQGADGVYRSPSTRYKVGDRLWVRESVRAVESSTTFDHEIEYRADGATRFVACDADIASDAFGAWWLLSAYRASDPDLDGGKWVPSIHMPRWASRLTLTVTEVRVQRLQDITEADAIAEGVKSDVWGSVVPFLADPEAADAHPLDRPVYWAPGDDREDMVCLSARDAYARIWESIHGVGMWGLNGWVAAYTFKVAAGNIDALAREAA